MKKFTFLIAFMAVGISAFAVPKSAVEMAGSYNYGTPFIFIERNVEFAVYPDGQFDFLFNPRGYSVNRIDPHVNMSFNAGYNYNPFLQYDDFGAVIQIENVPVYYDYYGRIIQAGSVLISYNNFGRISRIGNLRVHYNPYNQYTHYTGFINSYNYRYVPQPWHQNYRPPHQHYSVVYYQPYRAYYYPTRVKYSYHKQNYKKYYNQDFKRSYYRPGDNVVVYHRGRRTESSGEIRNRQSEADYSNSDFRSNKTSERDRVSAVNGVQTRSSGNRTTGTTENLNESRAFRTTSTSTRRTSENSNPSTVRVGSDINERAASARVPDRSNTNVQRAEQTTVRRAETVNRSSNTSTSTKDRTSTSRSSRGRG